MIRSCWKVWQTILCQILVRCFEVIILQCWTWTRCHFFPALYHIRHTPCILLVFLLNRGYLEIIGNICLIFNFLFFCRVLRMTVTHMREFIKGKRASTVCRWPNSSKGWSTGTKSWQTPWLPLSLWCQSMAVQWCTWALLTDATYR